MKYKIWNLLFLVLTIGLIGFGWLLLFKPELLGLCPSGPGMCIPDEFWTFGLGQPLFWGTRWLVFLSAVLLFVPNRVFRSWAKCTWWVALICLIFIALAPYQFTGYTPDRTRVTEWMVNIYVAISLLVIVYKSWRLHKK